MRAKTEKQNVTLFSLSWEHLSMLGDLKFWPLYICPKITMKTAITDFWITSKFYWTGTFADRESGNNETQVYISLCFSWYFTILAFQLPRWPLLKLSSLVICLLLKLYYVWRVLELSPWSYSLFFLLMSTLYSLSLWMISDSSSIVTSQLLTQIFISSQYPSPALQLLIFHLLLGIHFDV